MFRAFLRGVIGQERTTHPVRAPKLNCMAAPLALASCIPLELQEAESNLRQQCSCDRRTQFLEMPDLQGFHKDSSVFSVPRSF